MNTNTTAADVIKSLTVKGRDAMTQIGLGNVSFFDGGIVEGEGSWGGCLVDDLGHKSSGVLNRLLALGLFTHTDADEQDETNAGGWWTLTALGAEVANTLAKEEKAPATRELTKEELAEVQRGIDLDTIAAELDTNPWDEKPTTTEETPVIETPAPAKKAAKKAEKAPAAKKAVARRSEVLGTVEGKRIVKAKRYTVKEVAELLGSSPISVNRWIQMGYLTAEKSDPKDGRVVNLIPGSSVAEFVKGRAERAKKAAAKKAEKATPAKKATSAKKSSAKK